MATLNQPETPQETPPEIRPEKKDLRTLLSLNKANNPYFWEGYVRGGRLNSHDSFSLGMNEDLEESRHLAPEQKNGKL